MARGKRNIPLDEQLKTVNQEIEKLESSLDLKKKQKKIIEDQIAMNDVNELRSLLKSSGKTMDDVKEFLGVNKGNNKEKVKK